LAKPEFPEKLRSDDHNPADIMKVLLTGGSGFIAAHILKQLLERG
jgi:hypothetical protein